MPEKPEARELVIEQARVLSTKISSGCLKPAGTVETLDSNKQCRRQQSWYEMLETSTFTPFN